MKKIILFNKNNIRSGTMDKRSEEKSPNVSGSFQVVDDERKKDLKKLRKENKLDEKSEYYARIFMED